LKHIAACDAAAVVVDVQESGVTALIHNAHLVHRLFHPVFGIFHVTFYLVK
jgi:hypothetical protein